MTGNPLYDPYQILMKVYAEKAYLKQAIADTYIEEAYRSRTVKAAYGVLENDAYLSFCISHYAEKSPKLPVRVLLKTALYFLIFLEKKRYAVTDFAVELCKKLGKGGAAGFVNAFLRKFNEEDVKKALPAGKKGVIISTSYPEFAYDLLHKEYGSRAEKIAAAKSAGVSVRFLDSSEKIAEGTQNENVGEKAISAAENAAPYLEKADGGAIKTPFYGGYIFKNFARDRAYDEGKYTFQSVGSQAICDVIAPCGKLLDACAAPGRKNIRVCVKDSREYDASYEKAFDAVLCDVPCSGFGTVSENPDIKVLKDESVFSSLAEDQRKILDICSAYVKEGGMLYYSTCSIFRRENDAVVAEFLKNHVGFTPVGISSPLAHEKKKYGLQFLPDTAYGAGFYVAAMRKGEKTE